MILTLGFCELILVNKDTLQHDAFFIGHLALISSQDLLKILIREFKEASDDMYYVIRMKWESSVLGELIADLLRNSVMRLIKCWLTNENVIICNSTLSEIHKFAVTANRPENVTTVTTEIVQLIPDKVQSRLLLMNLNKLNKSSRPC